MGYRILYGSVKKARDLEKRVCRSAAMMGCLLVLFLLVISILWPEGSTMLRNLLYPGDPAVTASAIQVLMDDLSAGFGIYDAVSHFCIQILEGAGFASD